jgi:hypothetical protein
MTTQTAEISAVNKKNLIHNIEQLPDSAIFQIKGYVERIREEIVESEAKEEERRYQSMALEDIKAEIAALETEYGTTPNAETVAAIRELRAGKGERVTIAQIMAEFNAEH